MSSSVPEIEGIYALGMGWGGGWEASIFENVPFVMFMYPVFTCIPSVVTVGDSGLCCCVPCLLSAITSPIK